MKLVLDSKENGLFNYQFYLGLAEYIDRTLRGQGLERVIESKVQYKQVK